MTITHAFEKGSGKWVVSASSQENIIYMFGDNFIYKDEEELTEDMFDENSCLIEAKGDME